jgi:hypothetical protein
MKYQLLQKNMENKATMPHALLPSKKKKLTPLSIAAGTV